MPNGIDIAKISRFEKMSEELPKKIFSENEAEYIRSKKNRAQTAAGIFAAKEAFLKCCECGLFSAPLSEIEIVHFGSAPRINLSGSALELAKKSGFSRFDVSITHDGDYAAAVVSAENEKYFSHYKRALERADFSADKAISEDEIRALLPKRAQNAHKGTCGRLYAIAGSVGLTGAAILACSASLKCGAGLITLGCAKSLNEIFEISLREVMTKPLDDKNGVISENALAEILPSIKSADAVLAGPGLGKGAGIEKITNEILKSGAYAVLDADALNAISQNVSALLNHSAKLILTPHVGEFSRLSGISIDEILKNPKSHAVDFAKKYNVTLVLKSHKTVVATPDGESFSNALGNPGMATGGTGDVLCGAVASFAAQGLLPENAAKTGVYIHSLAADMASFEKGEYSLTPSDIVEFIPYALKFSSGR